MTNTHKVHKVKQKRHVSAQFLWFVLVLSALIFFVSFYSMPMFPRKWSWFLLVVLLAGLFLTGVFSSIASKKNNVMKVVNTVLSLALIIGSIYLPVYKNRVSDVINKVLGDKVNVNLYVLLDNSDNLADYANSTFITTVALDTENQNFATQEVRKELPDIQTIDRQSIQDAAASLFNGEGEVLIMSDAYEQILSDTEGYEDFSQRTKIIKTYVRTIETSVVKSDASLTKEPFTIFFGGNDQEGELSLIGRTDVDMLVSVNPNTHQIAIISFPRDSYIPNPALGGGNDKLTHLGIQGIQNTLDGLGAYVSQDIDHYVLINFTTYMKIIDAIGGIDVDNPYAFTYTWDRNYVFDEGRIHLDGQGALYYVRERYSLPDGDFGRNMHQQLVMSAILEKIASPTVITKFNDLLSAMNGTFLTNLSDSAIYGLCNKQLDENISWNIVRYGVLGTTGGAICASAPGQQLSVVFPYENQVQFVSEVIDEIYNGNILEQQEIPEGSHY